MNNNYDEQELKKFAQYQNNWWDLNGDAAPLHKINPIRMQFINQHIALNNKEVLDIGCGGGILAESLAKSQANVTAIDMCKEAIACAKEHAKTNNLAIEYKNTTAEEQARKNNNTYDVITCLELIEHVPNPAETIASCAELAKEGGIIFISTINRNIKAYAHTVIGAEYLLKIIPKGTHSYDKFIKPSELIKMAAECQLEFIGYAGISYKLFTDSFYLSEDVSTNYIACFKKVKR
jgi:2-polyprenyl-6-hydroxyphenyl methylase / 3-demethylubiquinone-9 3-methyltransferase